MTLTNISRSPRQVADAAELAALATVFAEDWAGYHVWQVDEGIDWVWTGSAFAQAFPEPEPEGWHYVGAMGEPAFENDWDNIGPHLMSPLPRLGFRRRGHVVDVMGYLYGTDATDPAIFHIPADYWPSGIAILECVTSSDFTPAGTSIGVINVYPDGFGDDGVVTMAIPSSAFPLAVVISDYYPLDPTETIV